MTKYRIVRRGYYYYIQFRVCLFFWEDFFAGSKHSTFGKAKNGLIKYVNSKKDDGVIKGYNEDDLMVKKLAANDDDKE